jgi:TonB family protein
VGAASGSSAAAAGGSIDPRVVHEALQPHVHAMRACYKKALAHDPKLGGEVRVRFVIDTEGRVTGAADAGSRLKNKDVVSCVVAEIASVHFPKPEGGSAPVVYPIVFAPGD